MPKIEKVEVSKNIRISKSYLLWLLYGDLNDVESLRHSGISIKGPTSSGHPERTSLFIDVGK